MKLIISLIILLLVLLLSLLELLPGLLAVRLRAGLGQLLLGVLHIFAVFLQILDVRAGGIARELGGGVGVCRRWSCPVGWIAVGWIAAVGSRSGLDVGRLLDVVAFLVGVLGWSE